MVTHKGTQTIITERLILRRAAADDAQAMFENWATDPEVTKFLRWPPHSSAEVTKRVIESWICDYKKDDFYLWMIVLKEINEPIGTISVVSLDNNAAKAEIGYCLGQKWWHCGIMTEALNGVIDYLFDEIGMNRIEAKHDVNNPHSGNVMRKCGMRFERTSRKSDWNNQGICDISHYAILKSDRAAASGDFYFADDITLVNELYRSFDESCRLTRSKAAQVEFLTNVRCIERFLTPSAKILDIGAGAGEYSFYFANKGYNVSAIELADSNIEAFRKKLSGSDLIDLKQGNALDLSMYPNDAFDIVLLFGPLYHLHSDNDKQQCIKEAKRVCKPDGKIFFAFISNDIVILTMQQTQSDYLLNGAYDKDSFKLIDYPFVFHTVERCREVLHQGGIKIIQETASDGVSELFADYINSMDKKSYEQYLRYHFYICEKPECLGLSNHLLFVGEK